LCESEFNQSAAQHALPKPIYLKQRPRTTIVRPSSNIREPPVIQSKKTPYESHTSTESAKNVVLRHDGPYYDDDRMTCKWTISLLPNMSGQAIIDKRKWTDSVVARHAFIQIRRLNPEHYPPIYQLTITGKGYDGRCLWCKSFRKSIETHFSKIQCGFEKIGGCHKG
jgi:hypothetical protein